MLVAPEPFAVALFTQDDACDTRCSAIVAAYVRPRHRAPIYSTAGMGLVRAALRTQRGEAQCATVRRHGRAAALGPAARRRRTPHVGAAKRCAALRRFDEAAAHLQVSAPFGRSDSARHYHRVHSSSLTHSRRGVATVNSATAGAPSDRPARAVRTRPPIEGNRTRLSHSVQRAACHPPRNVCDPPPPTAQRTPPRSVDIAPAHRRTRSAAALRGSSGRGRSQGAPAAVQPDGIAVRRQ